MNDNRHDLSQLAIDPSLKNEGTHLSYRQFFFPGLIVTALAVVVLIYLWNGRNSEESGHPQAHLSSGPEVSQPIVMRGSSDVLNATGYVVAQRQAAVSSKATGRLKQLLVVEGDKVTAGQILGVLENDDLNAIVKQELAYVEVLRARVSAADAEAIEASRQYSRLQTLHRSGASAQADLDESRARHISAQADLTAAKANVQLGEARYEKAMVDLSYTNILAPFDGTVLTKDADVGEIVAPFGSSTNARAAIVTIADMKSLEVEADVSEANLTKVFVGQTVDIVLDSIPSKQYKGVVSKIVPTVDRAKATVMTKIRFLDLDERVIPEMSAKVAFQLQNS